MNGAAPEVPGLGPVLALVLAVDPAVPPPGMAAGAFADACLADGYEVLADLEQVGAGVVTVRGHDWPAAGLVDDLLWPGDRAVTVTDRAASDLRLLAAELELAGEITGGGGGGLLVLPADVPDLPGLVPAKLIRGLLRGDVCTAPELGGPGLAGFAVRLPWPAWLDTPVCLRTDPHQQLLEQSPRRGGVTRAPGWHRLRTPEAVHRLDPGLEGWELTRSLLGG